MMIMKVFTTHLDQNLMIKMLNNAGYNYVLKDVKDFIRKTESMSEKLI